MRQSLTCPQCKHPVDPASGRVGAMILCSECLVSFPSPEMGANPPLRPFVTVGSDPEVDIRRHRLGADSGWGLVRVGLNVVLASLIVLFVGALIAILGEVTATKHVRILAALVASASVLTGLMGVCLCCNAPRDNGLRNSARTCVAALSLSGLAALGLFVQDFDVPEIHHAESLLWIVTFGMSVLAGISWILYLNGVATFFHAPSLEILGVHLLMNLCIGVPIPFFISMNPQSVVLPLLISYFLYLWHFALVLHVRHTIPLMKPSAPVRI